jgi:hypothetical protein
MLLVQTHKIFPIFLIIFNNIITKKVIIITTMIENISKFGNILDLVLMSLLLWKREKSQITEVVSK